MPRAFNFIKKETLAQVSSCKFCEISKNTCFTEHLWMTASIHSSKSSDTAEYLILSRLCPVKLEIPSCFAALICFTMISNLAVTTPISVSKVRADLFCQEYPYNVTTN